MISKYSSALIIFLVLINLPILMEVGHGECVPYSDSFLGCSDKDSDAQIKKINFEYKSPPDRRVEGCYLPDTKIVKYTVKFGSNVDDGTSGELVVYPSKWAPGNPSPEVPLMSVPSTSRDNEMIFIVNLQELNDKHVLGNLSNKLYLNDNDEPIEFEGPYIWYNVFNLRGDPKIDSKDGIIERITMRIRANETSLFGITLTNKETGERFVINSTQQYVPDGSNNDFAELKWYPRRTGNEIKYINGTETYSIALNPK